MLTILFWFLPCVAYSSERDNKNCEIEMSWLDMYFNAGKSCVVRWGPRHSKIMLTFSWMAHRYVYVGSNSLVHFGFLALRLTPNASRRFPLHQTESNSFSAFNLLYLCVCLYCSFMRGIMSSLNTFCLPIFFRKGSKLSVSNANLRTLCHRGM